MSTSPAYPVLQPQLLVVGLWIVDMSSHDLLQNYLPAVVVVKFKNPALHEQALVSEEYEVEEASQVAAHLILLFTTD